jgi:CHAP domain
MRGCLLASAGPRGIIYRRGRRSQSQGGQREDRYRSGPVLVIAMPIGGSSRGGGTASTDQRTGGIMSNMGGIRLLRDAVGDRRIQRLRRGRHQAVPVVGTEWLGDQMYGCSVGPGARAPVVSVVLKVVAVWLSARVMRRLALAVLLALLGVLVAASAAHAFGSSDARWKAYYSAPGNESTWEPFCAGGGGKVIAKGDGVMSCGPAGEVEIEIPGGISTPGFQCVELSERFLYVTRGWTTIKANGAQVAARYASAHGVPLIANGTAGVAPHVGDVMSFSRTSSFSEPEAGHTGVVTASAVDSSGNGTITLLSENVGHTGNSTTVAVTGWRVVNLFGEFPSSEWIQSGTGGTTACVFFSAGWGGDRGGVSVQSDLQRHSL